MPGAAIEPSATGEFSQRERLWLAAFVFGFGVLVWLLGPALQPFLIAAALAYLGDPIVDWLERARLSRTVSVVVVYIVLTLVSLLALILLVPLLERQIGYLITRLPEWLDWVQRTAIPYVQSKFGLAGVDFDMASLTVLVRENWSQAGGLAANALSVVSKSGLQFLTVVANLVIVPIAAFYLLRDWDRMVARIGELLPRRIEPTARRLALQTDDVLAGFLRGQLLVMLSLAIIYVVGLYLVGIKLALLLGLFAGLLSFVPYLGLAVGYVAACVIGLFQTQDPWTLLWISLVFGAAQLFESAVLTPLFVGDRIGLHPVGVIFAVMAGGQLFGFVGVLLALPAAAIVVVLLRHFQNRYLDSEIYQATETPSGAAGDRASTDL